MFLVIVASSVDVKHDQHTLLFYISVVFFLLCLTTDIDTAQIDPHGIMDKQYFPNTMRISCDVFLTGATSGLLHRGPIYSRLYMNSKT